jgi:L-alanine-DL-glutamate epimerase-like enolase superfamily enzyme
MLSSYSIDELSNPLREIFAISRGETSAVTTIKVTLTTQNADYGLIQGRGECRPYARFSENSETTTQKIHEFLQAYQGKILSKSSVQSMPASPARNAIDCALWDLHAKTVGTRVHQLLSDMPDTTINSSMETFHTIGLKSPHAVGQEARSMLEQGIKTIKLKLGEKRNLAGDIERITQCRAAAPDSKIIIDVNEGWLSEELVQMLPICKAMNIALIEQPLSQESENFLRTYKDKTPVPIYADESIRTRLDLPLISKFYQGINIKLDKTGGLTEALLLAKAAHQADLSIMVGCMVAGSLAIAPAYFLASYVADIVDLDGACFLSSDCESQSIYNAGKIYMPDAKLWG